MYNFDEIVDRRHSGSIKWDLKNEQELPMWVADMDFRTAPAILEALHKKVEHGILGYSEPGEAWSQAYIDWWNRRHHYKIDPEWLIFSTGVVPAISTAVRKLTTPAENVLVLTPVYNIFFNSILNNGRNVIQSPLIYDEDRSHYTINFDELEQKLANPQTKLMILCNPQNPTGRIWNRDELARIGELCAKYHVIVISDEIHCDIMQPGKEYIPFASVSDICSRISVTCIAPTKCFNIAGVQTAAVCVPDPYLRHQMWRALNTDEVAEGNAFSYEAAVAAWNEGENWLNELCKYISENINYIKTYIEREIPKIKVIWGGAGYLVWLDCGSITNDGQEFVNYLRSETGLWLSAGNQYGEGGQKFVRLNAACPRSRLDDGMNRLKLGVERYLIQ